MADEPIQAGPIPQEPAVVAAAPAEPAVAPVETQAQAPAEPAVADAKPADEFARADAEPTLLETVKAPGQEEKPAETKTDEKTPDVKAEEAKPAEGDVKPDAKDISKPEDKKVDAPKVEEAKPTEPANPEPVEYKYELPETIKMDDALKGEVHSALDAFRADPTNVQPLIDLHAQRMEAYAEHLNREQHRVFAETRKEWRKEIMADPILGGAGHDTAMQTVARMRDMFVSDHPAGSDEYNKDMQSFDGMVRVTGVGDHPVFMHFLHRMARFFDEPTIPSTEINPPKDIGRSGRPGKVLYDHPTSNRGRQ